MYMILFGLSSYLSMMNALIIKVVTINRGCVIRRNCASMVSVDIIKELLLAIQTNLCIIGCFQSILDDNFIIPEPD